MEAYKKLVNTVLSEGKQRPSGRNIPNTISYFSYTYKHDLEDGFPLLTTKRMSFSAIVNEVLWYISGDRSIKGHNIPFWEPWADPKTGVVPSAYGYYWRFFPEYEDGQGSIDQLSTVISQLRDNPFTRRAVISAWHPGNAVFSKLPPCHILQVYNYDGERLNLHLTQRSADIPIGVPFNLAGYALMLMLVAQVTNLTPGIFSHTLVDAHIYEDQIETILTQMQRDCRPLPRVVLNPQIMDIDKFRSSDFAIFGYDPHLPLVFPVAI